MSKVLKKSNLAERPASRTLLAVSLFASIAAFGCTTDRTLGDGDPVVTPGLRTSPTGGTSAGSETESVPPPMMSSYSGHQPLPVVRKRVSREEAALLLTEMQPRVRVLGPASPNSGGRPYVSDLALLNTQAGAERRLTVNSSIYSGPNAVVTSGAGGAAGTDAGALFTDTASVDAANVATGVTSSATVAGSAATNGATVTNAGTVTNPGGAVIAPSTAAAATPTGSAFTAPPAFASVRTLSPTAAAVVNPPASVSGSTAAASVSSARTAGVSATRNNTAVSTSTAQPSISPTTSASVTNPVRVVTANGRVTVTNVSTNRQQ